MSNNNKIQLLLLIKASKIKHFVESSQHIAKFFLCIFLQTDIVLFFLCQGSFRQHFFHIESISLSTDEGSLQLYLIEPQETVSLVKITGDQHNFWHYWETSASYGFYFSVCWSIFRNCESCVLFCTYFMVQQHAVIVSPRPSSTDKITYLTFSILKVICHHFLWPFSWCLKAQ